MRESLSAPSMPFQLEQKTAFVIVVIIALEFVLGGDPDLHVDILRGPLRPPRWTHE